MIPKSTHDVGSRRRDLVGSSHLFLTINKNLYRVERLACGPDTVERAFRLNKVDGTLYDVAQTRFGAQCDCPDFIFRRDGLDPSGCKHVKALVGQGLIDGETEARPQRGSASARSRRR
jgi:hypothetical protein